jgi:hypothetical protein
MGKWILDRWGITGRWLKLLKSRGVMALISLSWLEGEGEGEGGAGPGLGVDTDSSVMEENELFG